MADRTRVVISQSMLFPWVGMLEQIRLADVFVHYDDVQFSKGSFVNRVQVKLEEGARWMTVPLPSLHLGQRIDEVEIAPADTWREKHLQMLRRSFEGAPHARDALSIAEQVYATDCMTLGALARASMIALAEYFGLTRTVRFVDVTELGVPGSGSERVLDVVRRVAGDEYITGHGASRYLDHSEFERAGIGVRYMAYRRSPYPQRHGAFDPHVTGLDLVANCGKDGAGYIAPQTVDWREYRP